jgi:excisionase family DNA binding protein
MELLTVREAAEFIRVKKETIYHYTHMKEIPYVKVGKKVLFKKDVLENWINARTVPERKIK